jgi:hypothetical protein
MFWKKYALHTRISDIQNRLADIQTKETSIVRLVFVYPAASIAVLVLFSSIQSCWACASSGAPDVIFVIIYVVLLMLHDTKLII